MRSHKIILYHALVFLLWQNGIAQTGCTVPLPPELTNVSVNQVSGMTEIRWNPSPSPNIDAYIVYTYSVDGGQPRGDAVDTIWAPGSTFYSYYTIATSYYKVNYVVASYRKPVCGSQFSNVLSTIFCNTALDTCNKEIRVSWNSYNSVPDSVKGYTVFASAGSGPMTPLAEVGPGKQEFYLQDFLASATYSFWIRANLKSGASSWSNRSTILTRMQRAPSWINADFATVNDDGDIDLKFTIDPLSEIKLFSIERKGEGDQSFIPVARKQSDAGNLLFTDSEADPSKNYVYRLAAVNNCNKPVVWSNNAVNIVTTAILDNEIIRVVWNQYRGWRGGAAFYELFIDTGQGFSRLATTLPGDTTYSLQYSNVMTEISGSKLCFQVSARENLNEYGITGTSTSGHSCIESVERITVPNAFTPDNDLLNDLFRPVLSFNPVRYRLIITDRNNNLMFETGDYLQSWDGKKGGSEVQQGAYIWYLSADSPSGRNYTRNGTVTIIRNR